MDFHKKLEVFRITKRIPHILFYGESGTGKKNIVHEFIRSIYQDSCNSSMCEPTELTTLMSQHVMWVNCAQGKGIKFVRNELKMFAQTNVGLNIPFKTIVLLNADFLTIDAQSALRRCMEKYSQTARFFGIVRNRHKILCPILSRFCEIHISAPPSSTNEPETCTEFKPSNLHKTHIQLVFPFVQSNLHHMHERLTHVLGLFDESYTTTKIMKLVSTMYDEGVSSLDLLNWLQWCDNTGIPSEIRTIVCMNAAREKPEYRNEKMFMYRIVEEICVLTQ